MVAFGIIEGPVGASRQLSTTPYREGGPLWAAGCFAAPYQGLSPVRGNLHAGFLGEGRAARFAPYPTTRLRFALLGAQRLPRERLPLEWA